MSERALVTQKLGRYDIVRVLGKGAMGVVYEANDPNLNRKVAIKTVRVNSLSKDEAAEYELRFRTEAHSAARLQHPNIVSVYDADRDGDTPFLVMEFVKGEDLKHYLDTGQRYTLEQSIRMLRDLLAALEYAHQRKIIHRDIKPANLLIESDGRVKLTDFGVARIQDSGEATRTQGGLVGTLKYMSPEQVAGHSADASSDIFSAGIVLYQLLTDSRPFDGDSYFSIVTAINSHDPPAPSSINALLPAAMDAVVAKALAKDKTHRFASALEFATALQEAGHRADMTITPSANPYKIVEPMATNARERSGASGYASVTGGSGSTFSGSTVTQELELVYWKDIKDSGDREDLEGFLSRFPEGIYAELAKRRLRKLMGTASESNPAIFEATVTTPSIAPKSNPSATVAAPISIVIADTPSVLTPASSPAEFIITTPLPVAATKSEPQPVDLHIRTIPPTLRPGKVDAALAATVPPKPAELHSAARTAEPDLPIADVAAPTSPRKTSWLLGTVALLMLAVGGIWWGNRNPATTADKVGTQSPLATQVVQPRMAVESTPQLKPVTAVPAGTATVVNVNTSTLSATAPTNPSSTSTVSAIKTAITKILPKVAKPVTTTTRVESSTTNTSPSAAPAVQSSPAIATAPGISAPYKLENPHASSNAPSPPKAPAPLAPTVSKAQGPREVCADKILFAYGSCLNEQCERPLYLKHPVCIERREQDEARKAADSNR